MFVSSIFLVPQVGFRRGTICDIKKQEASSKQDDKNKIKDSIKVQKSLLEKDKSNCQPIKPLPQDVFMKSNESKSAANVSFGYKHALKTAWKEGLLPTVTKGLYGNELTLKNISLEHLTPVSKGGKTILENLALAQAEANMARGAKPLSEVLTLEQLTKYLEQFKNVRARGINGNKYIRMLMEKAVKVWHLK